VGLAKRPWAEEDNARLKEFVAQGASIIRAAAALHRNILSVRIPARKLGDPFPPMRVFRKKLVAKNCLASVTCTCTAIKFSEALPGKRRQ
jgi:hypothetical protein